MDGGKVEFVNEVFPGSSDSLCIGACNSQFKNLLGEITRLHVDNGVYENQLPLGDEEMEQERVRLWRAVVAWAGLG